MVARVAAPWIPRLHALAGGDQRTSLGIQAFNETPRVVPLVVNHEVNIAQLVRRELFQYAEIIRERIVVEKTVAQEEEKIKEIRVVEEARREKEALVIAAEAEAEENFVRFFKDYDRRRNLNFCKTFPEYADLYKDWSRKYGIH